MKRLVYFCNCLIRPTGHVDPFLVTEWPWLTEAFDRVDVVGERGVATLDKEPTKTLAFRSQPFTGLQAALMLPLRKELYQELWRLLREKKASPANVLRLIRFAWRGLCLYQYARPLLEGHEKPTLYSFWLSFDGYAAALCHRKCPEAHFVARGHAFDVDVERTPMNPYLMKQMIVDEADGIYVISQLARKQLMAYMQGRVPEEKVSIVPVGSSGEPVEEIRPAPRFTQGVLRVISCSAVLPIKQLPVLVDALSQWQGMPLHWLHVGGGEGFADLQTYADEKLSSKENVVFELRGPMDNKDVNALYMDKSFDVFLNTSRKEGTPVSIMEAMRFGIPVIAPNVGGIPELVTPEVGWLYDPALGAEGVLLALSKLAALSPDEDAQMREAVRRRWNEHYCLNEILPRMFPEARNVSASKTV